MSTPERERKLLLTAEAVRLITADSELRERVEEIAVDFRSLIPLCKFRDPDNGIVYQLDDLWLGQEQLVDLIESCPRWCSGKSRKLGFTTIAISYCVWVLLTFPSCRVHLYSRGDDSAVDLLERVKFVVESLPPWLKPAFTATTHTITLGSGDDKRVVQAYATGGSGTPAVEQTATHSLIDEWSKMQKPETVLRSIEPTFGENGTAHILFTSEGVGHHTSRWFEKVLAGDIPGWRAFFASAELRPGRDEAFFDAKRRALGSYLASKEYPRTILEMLSSGSDQVFKRDDLDIAHEDTCGPMPREDGYVYVQGVDVAGEGEDSTVLTILRVNPDPKEAIVDVVHVERLTNRPAPEQQQKIERLHRSYGCFTAVETTGIGWGIWSNLDLPENECAPFSTTRTSKPKLISDLEVLIESGHVRYDPEAWPALDLELHTYERNDEGLSTDHVLSLAIAVAHIDRALAKRKRKGKFHRPIAWGGGGDYAPRDPRSLV